MGSSIDTRPPASQPHLTLYGRDYAAKKRATTEAAFADLKMIQSIARTMTRKPQIPERSGPVSLNAETRKTEIFRIMKENHRLLDKLETLEPVVSTADLQRSHKDRLRYTILVSHSKRLAGEYDGHVQRIRTEDKAKMDAYWRSVDVRKAKYAKQQGSNSMPSLTPLASTDPTPLGTGTASPTPSKNGKPLVTKKLNGAGGSSSSNSGPAAKASPASADGIKRGDSKVQFLSSDIPSPQGENKTWEREGGPTPHPTKIKEELLFKDGAEVDPNAPDAEPAGYTADAPAEASAADPAPAAAESAGYSAEAPAEVPAETAPAQEFDPAQAQTKATEDPASPAAEGASLSYEQDFNDETQQSATFESSQG